MLCIFVIRLLAIKYKNTELIDHDEFIIRSTDANSLRSVSHGMMTAELIFDYYKHSLKQKHLYIMRRPVYQTTMAYVCCRVQLVSIMLLAL